MRVVAALVAFAASVSVEPQEVAAALHIAEQVAYQADQAVHTAEKQEVAHVPAKASAATPSKEDAEDGAGTAVLKLATPAVADDKVSVANRKTLEHIAKSMRKLATAGNNKGTFAAFGHIADAATVVLVKAQQAHSTTEAAKILADGVKAVQQQGAKTIADETAAKQAEAEASDASLLMGVLTTHKDWTREEQMDAVAKFAVQGCYPAYLLFRGNATRTPLNQQLAELMDQRGSKPPSVVEHAHEMAELAAFKAERKMKKSMQIVVTTVDALKGEKNMTAEEQEFFASAEGTLAAMQSAVAQCDAASAPVDKEKAVLSGDKALQGFLTTFAKMRAGGKLGSKKSLLQVYRSLQRARDCPYCVEQCIEKCHVSGKKFSTCLVSCADAGKR
mmetsp:Transcript_7659/g.16485  ORF Transcript_7659/g.16485 Transcript_7659/m.16485 type:complete len:389 (+) Transcript_7659:80-1246(+)|eukprot:CAMPEP_0204275352 /NCGR_PEP_ID=MMETSP0468-20130131/25847_1 /ASSEMBLY_ACC=CAM_ASM_000383 /TAXON_ID=2969 /ORGANISM="Oxyrrhis marina" /LENGTH=388 /DNA_ID=CAMNT_0051251687 /DNA_START=61 /DNA_END=1227 /DNA_ORIENTATION=-